MPLMLSIHFNLYEVLAAILSKKHLAFILALTRRLASFLCFYILSKKIKKNSPKWHIALLVLKRCCKLLQNQQPNKCVTQRCIMEQLEFPYSFTQKTNSKIKDNRFCPLPTLPFWTGTTSVFKITYGLTPTGELLWGFWRVEEGHGIGGRLIEKKLHWMPSPIEEKITGLWNLARKTDDSQVPVSP